MPRLPTPTATLMPGLSLCFIDSKPSDTAVSKSTGGVDSNLAAPPAWMENRGSLTTTIQRNCLPSASFFLLRPAWPSEAARTLINQNMKTRNIDRRHFLATAATAGAGLATVAARDWSGNKPTRYPDPDLISLDPRFDKYKPATRLSNVFTPTPIRFGPRAARGTASGATLFSATSRTTCRCDGSRMTIG